MENFHFRLFAANGKTETVNFRLFSANGKLKFAFFGQQTINGNRRLLFGKRAYLWQYRSTAQATAQDKEIWQGRAACRLHRISIKKPHGGRVWPLARVKKVTALLSNMSFIIHKHLVTFYKRNMSSFLCRISQYSLSERIWTFGNFGMLIVEFLILFAIRHW